jgi:hypothetical protein
MNMLRGIRDDGQMFAVWDRSANPEVTPEFLRKALDGMLENPALPFVANADEKNRERLRSMFKGDENWIEEKVT